MICHGRAAIHSKIRSGGPNQIMVGPLETKVRNLHITRSLKPPKAHTQSSGRQVTIATICHCELLV